MRLKLLVVAIFALSGLILSGCDSKKNDVAPTGYFSFYLDNVLYKSSSTAGYITDTITAGKKTLVVDGVTNNFGKHLELMITFPDSVKAGQYTTGVAMYLMDIQQKTDGFTSKTLQVKLDNINSKQAEGTFSGTLTSGETEKPLTDGTFKVIF